MLGLFKNKNDKTIDKYLEKVGNTKPYLLSFLGTEFPEESMWLLMPDLDTAVDEIIPAAVFKMSTMIADVPESLSEKLKKELFKKYEASDAVFYNYSRWFMLEYDDLPAESSTSTDEEFIEFLSDNLGRYICFEMQQIFKRDEIFKKDGQEYRFSARFANVVGYLLYDFSLGNYLHIIVGVWVTICVPFFTS